MKTHHASKLLFTKGRDQGYPQETVGDRCDYLVPSNRLMLILKGEVWFFLHIKPYKMDIYDDIRCSTA